MDSDDIGDNDPSLIGAPFTDDDLFYGARAGETAEDAISIHDTSSDDEIEVVEAPPQQLTPIQILRAAELTFPPMAQVNYTEDCKLASISHQPRDGAGKILSKAAKDCLGQCLLLNETIGAWPKVNEDEDVDMDNNDVARAAGGCAVLMACAPPKENSDAPDLYVDFRVRCRDFPVFLYSCAEVVSLLISQIFPLFG